MSKRHGLTLTRFRDLRARYRFFVKHAGGIVGQCAKGAIALARAERWAERQDLEFVWRQDEDADLGDHAYWCDVARWQAARDAGRPVDRVYAAGNARYRYSCEHVIEWCAMIRPCPTHGTECKHAKVLESLSGIIDADRDYRRVVEAELALEECPIKIARVA